MAGEPDDFALVAVEVDRVQLHDPIGHLLRAASGGGGGGGGAEEEGFGEERESGSIGGGGAVELGGETMETGECHRDG